MEDIIPLWFPNDKFQKFWFDKSIDKYIIDKYTNILKNKENINIDIPKLDKYEILQYIILFDQFSRHIYRNSNPKKNDDIALYLSKYFISNYDCKQIKFNYLIFILMPLRHSNDINNYNIIIKILDEIKTSLDNNFIDLYNKFYKITMLKYKKMKL